MENSKDNNIEPGTQPTELVSYSYSIGMPAQDYNVGSTNNAQLGYIAAGAISVAALSYPNQAYAGIDDVLDKLVSLFSDMFEPVLGGIFGGFGSILGQGSTESTSAITKANAAGADMVVTAQREIANLTMTAATAPPPDFCRSDELGGAHVTASTNATQNAQEILGTSAKVYSKKSKAKPYSAQLGDNVSKYADETNTAHLKHIKIASTLSQTKITDHEDVKSVIDGIEIMTSGITDRIDLNPSDATSSQQVKRERYVRNSAVASRAEFAKAPFIGALADRLGSDGVAGANAIESKMSIYEKEIERTYGGEGEWREQIGGYANPTPLLSEACKQLALNNSLLLDCLKKTEQQTLLLATSAIENIERGLS